MPSKVPGKARTTAPWQILGLALVSAALASCGGGGGDGGGGGGGDGGNNGPVTIRTVSNRADLISDGDALVEVNAPAGVTSGGITMQLNGSDITSAFVDQGGGRFLGLVTGLRVGSNVVQARTVATRLGAPQGAQLAIANASRSGPVMSGAQVTPYYCATPTPQPPSGNTPATNASGLSGQPDTNCTIATETRLYYRTTAAAGACSTDLPDPAWNSDGVTGVIAPPPSPPANPCWKPYTGGAPFDMATATTDNHQSLPFIVRVERGTIDRGIYDIAVLFQPGSAWTAVAPQAQWNGKVYYAFGGGTGQPRRQTRPEMAWSALEEQLGRGWLVATNGMSDSALNSNRVLLTETVMMMKEHIGDTYGPIHYTLGVGGSGGALNANMNLSIFPVNLDGIITEGAFPDFETTALEIGDCTLLVEAYQRPEMLNLWTSLGLTQDQINARKAAINGHVDQTACHGWYSTYGGDAKSGVYYPRVVAAADNATGAITQSPAPTNNCKLPNSAVYDPAHPATTASLPRCDPWSWAAPVWGQAAGSPAAKMTRDNVGVQYGLGALLAGRIGAEEFVTLNEIIGGSDRDAAPTAQRATADADALAIAYRAGIVASGANLAKAAIIDLRGWDESQLAANAPPGRGPGLAIHLAWYSFAIRDRITRGYGDAGSQALWRFSRTGLTPPGAMRLEAFNVMDKWLSALVTDTSGSRIEAKVRANRPGEAKDFCLLPGDAAQTNRIYDITQCDQEPTLKPSQSPRQVAGGPSSEDILKCQLKPLMQWDYPSGTFTADQFRRLQTVFSTGVCDWSKPGVGQQAAQGPLSFQAGPGGQPLGSAPVSSGL